MGHFPACVILHSLNGLPEVVAQLTQLGSYFSFSGHLMPLEEDNATEIVKRCLLDRILLETDAPDALPTYPIYFVPRNYTLNQPANVQRVLIYVASLQEMSEEELTDISYNNAVRVFSSKVQNSMSMPMGTAAVSLLFNQL
ncbi:putative Ubiquitin carboxyl-terminal hydrolase family protein [Hibiscus syriacus]|uniref:Ubiquitin carboxyl-terminal hydrolase family protein n=1 Tax=Hibiscus syriacus TaxID=106335 RepID=A0A6A3AT80_HIBSY|nr:putative Ubiquitin carboxyl-terminal hydrolase family protein [Hibiscus syriacus]